MNFSELRDRLEEAGFHIDLAKNKQGGLTETVLAFQRHAGLVEDGVVGLQTRAALRQATTPFVIRRVEPDKTAMAGTFLITPPVRESTETPPPNASSIRFLSTARPISEIIVHCTATPEGKDFTVEDIRGWHKARGWSDIGYHFVIYRDGRVLIGRPIGQIGAHCENHNSGTIGVSYVGGVSRDGRQPLDTRTTAQFGSMIWLLKSLRRQFPGIRKISGHNEYARKACPSFDVQNDPISNC